MFSSEPTRPGSFSTRCAAPPSRAPASPFTANRPVTLGVMVVDWEENLGLGTERNRSAVHHPGDGGFVAVVEDASGRIVAVTNDSWRAQTFYIAPPKNRDCLVVDGTIRDSTACDTSDMMNDPTEVSAAHWSVPADWMTAQLDDSRWSMATTFTKEAVGADNKRAFRNFTEIFDGSKQNDDFIWPSNVVLDNLVLFRKIVE